MSAKVELVTNFLNAFTENNKIFFCFLFLTTNLISNNKAM